MFATGSVRIVYQLQPYREEAKTAPPHSSQTVPVMASDVRVVSKSAESGGPCRGRTYGPLIKSQLLYQLS